MNKRELSLDLIKILACFLVIVNHAGSAMLRFEPSALTTILYLAFFSFSKIAVPLFIMVTGALLLNKQDSYRTVLIRVVKILIPLLVISAWLYFITAKNPLSLDFFLSILSKPVMLPYWYLYMLIGLYLVSPFLGKMVRNFTPNDHRIFMVLTLIIPGILPILSKWLDLTFYRAFFDAAIPSAIGYFCAGYYFNTVKADRKTKILLSVILVLSLTIMISSMSVAALQTGTIDYFLDNITLITTVIPTLCVFILIRSSKRIETLSESTKNVIPQIAGLTFGIYLIHYFLIIRLNSVSILITLYHFSPVLGALSVEVLVFVLGAGLIWILKKIPWINKVL